MMNAIAWNELVSRIRREDDLAALEYPLPAARRIAAVGARLKPERRVRSFPYWRSNELEEYEPQTLAGPRAELIAVGALRQKRLLELKFLRYPLVVLSSLSEGPLSQEQHDRLWDLFGLPVYEQIRGFDQRLYGWECDARAGWHLALDEQGAPEISLERLEASGWRGDLVKGICACGMQCQRIQAQTSR